MTISTVLAVGDSVVWGQGLSHEDKFASLIARRFGETLPPAAIAARSGAIIGMRTTAGSPIPASVLPDRTARHEVPNDSPTIGEQVADVPAADAAEVDLLIVNGGINDIDFRSITDPGREHDDGAYDPPVGDADRDETLDIEDLVRGYCYEDAKSLLERAREKFPNAIIVFVGYYPILSDASSTAAMVAAGTVLFGALGGPGGAIAGGIGTAAVAEAVVGNALYLHRRQLHWLRRAVAEVDADPAVRGPGVLFTHPGFAEGNSLLTDEPWLFGPGDTDPQRDRRRTACEATDGGLTCEHASVGHPNADGSRAYADAIEERVHAHRRRSLRGDLGPLADGETPLRVRTTLGRYGFDPSVGLRATLNHAVVDCIEVTVWTGGNGTDSDISLAVNDGDRWLLDTAWVNDFEADSRHVFTIDPHLSGRQRPLALADIDYLRVEKRGAFDWALDRLRVRINGRTVLDATPAVTLSGRDDWKAPYPR